MFLKVIEYQNLEAQKKQNSSNHISDIIFSAAQFILEGINFVNFGLEKIYAIELISIIKRQISTYFSKREKSQYSRNMFKIDCRIV